MTTKPEKRSEALYVRITPAEVKLYRRAAKAAERGHSDWIRWALRQAAKGGK